MHPNPMIDAINNSNMLEILLLLRRDNVKDLINIKGTEGTPPLILATIQNDRMLVDMLLDVGADINIISVIGVTPLMEASRRGHLDLVEYYLECGAKIHMTDNAGDTALVYACFGDSAEIAEYLIDKEASMYTEGKSSTPFHLCCDEGKTQCANMFLKKGIDVNLKDQHRTTPLMMAAGNSNFDLCSTLLKHGADVHMRDQYGQDALMYLMSSGNPDEQEVLNITHLLIKAGIDYSAVNDYGQSIIELAEVRRYCTIIKYLRSLD